MSMDLDFWKYKEGVYLDNKAVYERVCCDGEEMEGLETLPISDIMKRVEQAFSDWEKLDDKHYEHEKRGGVELFTTPQAVRFDCYGLSYDDMNMIIDIMSEFGCPLYDPQVSERFDGGM